MQAIYDLLRSEKAVAAGTLVAAATAFVMLGHISFADWREYTRDLLGIYIGGKTISSAASSFAARGASSVSTPEKK